MNRKSRRQKRTPVAKPAANPTTIPIQPDQPVNQDAATPTKSAATKNTPVRHQDNAVSRSKKEGRAERVLLWMELIGIPAGVLGLFLGVYQTSLATQALDDQKIANAWQILAIEGSGQNGKNYALNMLAQQGEQLISIDLSCKKSKEECEKHRTLITKVDLTSAGYAFGLNFSSAVLHDVKFGAISDSSFDNTILNNVSFDGDAGGGGGISRIALRNSQINDVTIAGGVITDLMFNDSNIYGLKFSKGIQIFPSSFNISGVSLCKKFNITDYYAEEKCNTNLDQEFFKQAFFIRTNPPKDLRKFGKDYLIHAPCEPGTTTKECDAQPLVPMSRFY